MENEPEYQKGDVFYNSRELGSLMKGKYTGPRLVIVNVGEDSLGEVHYGYEYNGTYGECSQEALNKILDKMNAILIEED